MCVRRRLHHVPELHRHRVSDRTILVSRVLPFCRFPYDPILQLRPPFARSLPVQVLLEGIVLTLSSVLLFQLLFTAQYHWPLAPVNFVLQVSAVITLLVTSLVTLYIVLSTVTQESRTWPYMLNYLAVDIPPSVNTHWPTADLAAWLLMTATTAGLIQVCVRAVWEYVVLNQRVGQITHIQFLTLLFPSKLERRLIYALLGPLAVISAVMQMLRVRQDDNMLNAISAVQNICNAALSLLFTLSLFLWGLLVNRKSAWRMDGGTAAFGVGALTLAPMSSTIALVYVPTKDQYTWMPHLMWAIILWQSFLGWWWWVGAGMGVGEVDELLQREEKRKMKRSLRMAKRRLQRERAETLWKGVTGAFVAKKQRVSPSPDRERPQRRPSFSSLSSGNTALWRIFNHPPGRQVYGWFLTWRHAHLTAAREQAVERVERMHHVYGTEGDSASTTRSVAMGWGLGARRREREACDDETIVASDSDQEFEMDVIVERPAEGAGEMKGELKVRAGAEGSVLQARRRNGRREQNTVRAPPQVGPAIAVQPTSMWWWGPLRRWRLQDSTEY